MLLPGNLFVGITNIHYQRYSTCSLNLTHNYMARFQSKYVHVPGKHKASPSKKDTVMKQNIKVNDMKAS